MQGPRAKSNERSTAANSPQPAMPAHLKPSTSPSPRDRLSRSPHPYHRQKFEIPHAAERFSSGSYAPSTQSPLRSRQNTDDETGAYSPSYTNVSTNSDSGTEADDEHFLKGLPAPKVRPHKGLRGLDGQGTPSPLLSPAIMDEREGYLRKAMLPSSSPDLQKTEEKFRQKRRVEVIRRVTETGILGFVAGILCLNPEVRQLIWMWRRGEFELHYPWF